MMRIAFAGASGTGKTVLAKHLAEKFALPFVPIGSRGTAKALGFFHPDTGEGLPYAVDAAGARQEFQVRLQGDKMAWELTHDQFVTDRTTIDELVYTQMHSPSTLSLVLNDGRTYTKRAIEHLSRYSHIFICPATSFISTGNDPARVAEIEYHHAFNAALIGWFGMIRDNERIFGACPKIWILTEANLEFRKVIVSNAVLPPRAVPAQPSWSNPYESPDSMYAFLLNLTDDAKSWLRNVRHIDEIVKAHGAAHAMTVFWGEVRSRLASYGESRGWKE